MTRFSVNCSILFTELPVWRRPEAAAAAGFDAVEFWWPFDSPVPKDSDVDRFVDCVAEAGVDLTGLNFAAGDMPAGDRGLVSSPADRSVWPDAVDVAVSIADRTGCRALNALYGNRIDGVEPSEQDDLAVSNLGLAARRAAGVGATVLIEALNSAETPRYPLTSAADAIGVCDRVAADTGAGNLAFLADFYHLARMGAEPVDVVAAHHDRIGHVQIADVPGRGEPGTGDLDVPGLLAALDRHGYPGTVGLEYRPSTGVSADSFGWLARM